MQLEEQRSIKNDLFAQLRTARTTNRTAGSVMDLHVNDLPQVESVTVMIVISR